MDLHQNRVCCEEGDEEFLGRVRFCRRNLRGEVLKHAMVGEERRGRRGKERTFSWVVAGRCNVVNEEMVVVGESQQ